MSKMSELDIDMQNAVDEGMKYFEKVKFSANAENELRETMQQIYSRAMVATANSIDKPVQQTLTVKKASVKVRPEIITGIGLILVAALFPVEDQNKIIFGFGVGIMYQVFIRDLFSMVYRSILKFGTLKSI